MKKYLSLLVMLTMSIAMSAEILTGDCGKDGNNLTYTLNTETGVLTIEGSGEMIDSSWDSATPWNSSRSYIKTVQIAEGVTSIGNQAFSNCSSLTSITIPSSVTSIGNSAFDACESLQSINLPNSVKSIGHDAFSLCVGLKSAILPTGLKEIPSNLFLECSDLVTVDIPESVEFIGQNAFCGCMKLASITIPESVTSIGSSAFSGCSSLTSITIPESVTSIGSSAFYGCSSLVSITLPFVGASKTATGSGANLGYILGTYSFTGAQQVKQGTSTYYIPSTLKSVTVTGGEIKANAFQNCSMLTSINISDGVTSIAGSSFSGCSSLESITLPFVGANKTATSSASYLGYIFGTSSYTGGWSTRQNGYTYYIPSTLKSVTITGGEINDYAFENCSALTSITIPENVTSIGQYSFAYCSSLTSVAIPDKVTSFGMAAFAGCSKLSSITIPDGVTNIAKYVFENCSALESITIPENVTSIENVAFGGCSALTSISIPDKVTSIAYGAFKGCTLLTSISIPKTVKSIGNSAFNGCSGLELITLPFVGESVDATGANALFGYIFGTASYTGGTQISQSFGSGTYTCYLPSKLKTVTISGGDIKDYSFHNCSTLTSITIPESATKIGNQAFYGCSSLGSITIPEGVTSIGSYAFNNCSSLTKLVYNAKNATINDASYVSPFSTALTSVTIGDRVETIPQKFVCGNTKLTSITLPESVKYIREKAFQDCSSLKSINISEGVVSIGINAFYGCSLLESINIPGSVESIGSYAFYGCSSLTHANLIEGILASIGESAFSGCSSLESITIPEGVTSIEQSVFQNCSSLSSAKIPEGVTSIGRYAFAECSSLQTIFLPEGVTSIGEAAFQNCSGLCAVSIPEGVKSIDRAAFQGCSSLAAVTIPSSVESLGASAFYGCTNLSSAVIPEGIKVIEYYEFAYCENLKSINIPKSIDYIYDNAFNGCTNLPVENGLRYADTYLVEIADEEPREVYSVRAGTRFMKENVFTYCETLKQVSLPESLQTLCSFEGCSNLTSINIPSLITELPSFFGCTKLKEMTFSENCQIYGYEAQWLQDVPLKNVDLSNCTNLNDVSIQLQNNNVIEAIKFPQKHHISWANISFVWCNSLKSIDLGYYVDPGIDDSENVSDEEGYYQDRFGGDIGIYLCDNLEEIFFGNFDLSLLNGWVTYIAGNPKLKRIGVSSNVADLLSLVTLNGDGATFTEAYYPFFKGLEQGELYIDGKNTAVEITFSENIEYIGAYTYYGMKNIERINIPSSVTSIGMSAFENCTGLSVVNFDSEEPLDLQSDALPYTCSIVVPDEAYDAYVTAWPDYKTQIVKRANIMADLELEADPHASALDNAIGQASSNNKITNVIDLKIKGTINSYDIMMIRNMMTNLHKLDLSEAKVVDCEKEYWDGYHSENDILGSYAFSDLPNLNKVLLPQVKVLNDAFAGCTNLAEVVLPEGLEVISERAFAGCTNLSGVTLPTSVRTIGKHAFDGCAYIGDINIPEGVKEIGDYAFHASGVAELTLPESLKRIGDYAFANNTNGSLKNLQLPPYVETIGESAFENCSGLEVININPMVKSIGDKAFLNLAKLKKVYTYTLEPINIAQTTFDRTAKAALYVPEPSFDIYYNDNKWSRFATKYPSKEEYEFKSVYLNGDYVMTDGTGIIGDQPDAELFENSALVNNASETQTMSELHVKYDGDNSSASVIGKITAEKVSVEIPVDGRKWYFFSFPFDIELSNISCSDDAQYVWRKYDGDLRAQTGTGWTNLTDATKQLCAGEGYIFQASDTCMLTLLVDAKTSFEGETVEQQLAGHTSQNAGDAGWNYVGTPFLSYYDIDDLSYDSPITVWNAENQTYEAIRPGDDDVTLHPFQAFFVQATGVETLTFDKEKQETGNQAQTSTAAKARARKVAAKDDSRLLINLELTNGKSTDKTRVVFNEEKSLAYEANCDAAKFMATGVPQLYTICDQNKYAINERPYDDGTVRLGFVAEKAGSFSIQATRMDTPCLLKDNKTGKVFDLTVGSYDFESEAGSFDNRFMLMGTAPTALDKFMAEGVSLQAQEGMLLVKGASQARIYNAAGALVAKGNGNHRLAKGTYIVEMGERSAKIVVK